MTDLRMRNDFVTRPTRKSIVMVILTTLLMLLPVFTTNVFASPPSVLITSPTATLGNNNTPLLSYSVSDGTAIVRVGGAVVSKVSGDNLDALPDGPHTVHVEATNASLETGFAEVTFTVDATPPTENVYIKIVAGAYHTTAIKSDGSLWAWGSNGNGQLGDGSIVNKYFPVQVGNDMNWTAISPGGAHTIALKSDGTLWAWGGNANGRLGDGTSTQRTAPVKIGNDANWAAITAGGAHTVALKTDGTLWAWGYNNAGQLGDGTTTDRNSPVRIGSDTNWSAISTRGQHTLALKSDGTLWAWGYNNAGQLGDGTTVAINAPVQVGTNSTWISIAAGGSHSIALKSDGTLWAWGYNNAGQLGDGSNVNKYFPVQVGSGTTWSFVAAGSGYTTALKSDNTLWTWGYNNAGQLGNGTTTNSSTPVQVGTGMTWTAVSGGNWHTIALRTDGTLSVWGDNSYGQLGKATSANSSTAVQIGFDTSWSMAAAGGAHTTALNNDGTLWSWGNNDSGQLGDGTRTKRTVPVKIGSDANWAVISARGTHTMALKSDSTLWAWGENANGQLGDGTNIDKTSPMQVGLADNWSAVSTGTAYTVALQSGTLWTWGQNNNGQLGDGTTTNRATPAQIGTDTTWTHVAAGLYHTIALKSDGSLWAWGVNSSGRLGDGTNVQRLSPVRIGGETTWSVIAAGAAHTVALKTDGTLWAWGLNANGQLGDGTTTTRLAPVQIGTDAAWTHIVAGQFHTTALKSDGSLWAWGNNCYGQLGDGTATDKHVPTRIGVENVWVSIANGQYHTVARKSNGSLWAWGYNASGQLGNGVISRETTPYQIASGNIVINDGAIATNNATVTLGLTALDASNIAEMQFRNEDAAWSVPEPYATTKTWTLSAEDGTKTVSVMFKDAAGNWSGAYAATITLDRAAPEVIITSPAAGTTNNKTPLLSYTVSDGSVIVMVDGAVVQKVSGATLDPLLDGPHTLRVEATDTAGNPGFAEVSFTVDTTAPFVSIDQINSVISTTYMVTGIMETGATISVSVNTTALAGPVSYPTATTWSCTITGLALGTNVVTAVAADMAGNTTSVFATLNRSLVAFWHLDGDGLDASGNGNNLTVVGSIFSNGNGDKRDGTAAAQFDGSVKYLYRALGKNLPIGNSPRTFTAWVKPFINKSYNGIFVYGEQNINYVELFYVNSSGRLHLQMMPFNTAQTTGSVAALNTWNQVAFTYDGAGTVKYFMNGQFVQSSPTGTVDTHNGEIRIGTLGSAGQYFNGLIDEVAVYNRALTDEEITAGYNAIAPSVYIVSPVGATNQNAPLLNYSVSNGTVMVKVDGTVVSKVSGSNLDLLSSGTHTVRVEAVNSIGKLGFAEAGFLVDTVPPMLSMDPVTSPTYTASQTITGTMESNAIIKITVDTPAVVGPVTYPTPTTWSCSITKLAAGDNLFVATAEDTAGNTTPASSLIRLEAIVILSVNISNNVINTEKSESSTIYFTLNRAATATIKIIPESKGSTGAPVYQDTKNCPAGGVYPFTWDGHDSLGNIVPDEAYLYVLSAGDGETSATYDPAPLYHAGTIICSQDSSCNPVQNDPLTVTYTLNQPGRVYLNILGQNANYNLISGLAFAPGTYSFDWDVRDTNGSIVNGCGVAACFMPSIMSENYIITTGDTPKILQAKTDPYALDPIYGQLTHLQYNLSREARVTITVSPQSGSAVTVVDDELQAAGYHDVIWNMLDATDTTEKRISTRYSGVNTVLIRATNPVSGAIGEARATVTITN